MVYTAECGGEVKLFMKVLDSEFAKEFIKLADDGWKHGFHERNGGNLSYRVKPEEVDEVKEDLDYTRDFTDIGTSVPKLSGEYFMVTGSGKYFSNVKSKPDENCCLIEIDSTGTKYRIVWGLTKGGRPTSELPSHLMAHEVKKVATNGKSRIINHCHPVNVIALTFVLPLDDKSFTRALWESMTECPIIFGDGVGVIPWMVPGGMDIAVETSKKMQKYNVVVWAHHGIFCSGTTFDEVFGLALTVEKSAEIYVKVASMSQTKLNTITNENFKQLCSLATDLGATISPEFLD